MSIGDFLVYLDIALLIIAMIFVVLINSKYLKRKLTKKQRFILEIGADIAIILLGIDTYIILIYFIKLSPYGWDAITITIGVFGMIVILILEIVMHYRRKKKSQKVNGNLTVEKTLK